MGDTHTQTHTLTRICMYALVMFLIDFSYNYFLSSARHCVLKMDSNYVFFLFLLIICCLWESTHTQTHTSPVIPPSCPLFTLSQLLLSVLLSSPPSPLTSSSSSSSLALPCFDIAVCGCRSLKTVNLSTAFSFSSPLYTHTNAHL